MKIVVKYNIINKGELSGSAYYVVHNSLGSKLRFKKPPLEYDIKKALSVRLADSIVLEKTEGKIDNDESLSFPVVSNLKASYGLMRGFLEGMMSEMERFDAENADVDQRFGFWNFFKGKIQKILNDLDNNDSYRIK